MCAIFYVMSDLAALSRMQFICDMDHLRVGEICWDTVQSQDSMAQELWRMACGQAQQSCEEEFLLSFSWPQMCAAFNPTDKKHIDKIRAIYKAKLRASLTGWEAARLVTHEVVQDMRKHQWWCTGLGMLCRTILKFGKESDVDCMCDYFALIFGGPGLQKPLEEFNKNLKEHILRIAATPLVRFVMCWALARIKGLPAMWGATGCARQSCCCL